MFTNLNDAFSLCKCNIAACPTNCWRANRVGADIDCTSCKDGYYLSGTAGTRTCEGTRHFVLIKNISYCQPMIASGLCHSNHCNDAGVFIQ